MSTLTPMHVLRVREEAGIFPGYTDVDIDDHYAGASFVTSMDDGLDPVDDARIVARMYRILGAVAVYDDAMKLIRESRDFFAMADDDESIDMVRRCNAVLGRAA